MFFVVVTLCDAVRVALHIFPPSPTHACVGGRGLGGVMRGGAGWGRWV